MNANSAIFKSGAKSRGFTLVEIMVSMGIICLAIGGMTSLMTNSSRSSNKTQIQSYADTDVALATERINSYLLEARSITIDANGQGITYKYPAKNTDGTYTTSQTAVETTSRRIYLSGTNIVQSGNTNDPILRHVPTTDPDTSAALKIFSAGLNGKEIVIRLVTKQAGNSGAADICSDVTTRIRPRNM